MENIDINTKLTDLTVGDLMNITAMIVSHELTTAHRLDTVSGIEGIASIFGVSLSTAKRIKASGVIDRAISQSGRVIITDVKLAKELYYKSTHSSRIGYSTNK